MGKKSSRCITPTRRFEGGKQKRKCRLDDESRNKSKATTKTTTAAAHTHTHTPKDTEEEEEEEQQQQQQQQKITIKSKQDGGVCVSRTFFRDFSLGICIRVSDHDDERCSIIRADSPLMTFRTPL